jgi:hypothetical protein
MPESMVTKLAKRDNYIYSGWHIDDYARFEIEVQGSMTALIWGPKGSLKSSYLLRRGFAVYGDWDKVLAHTVVEPLEFIQLIKRAKEEKVRLPFVGWDDLNAHLPRTLYFTSRSLYQSMKRNWDLLRPVFSVFMASCVRKTSVIGFILDDMDTEVVATKRRAEKGEDGTFNIAREVNVKVRRWVAYHNPYNRLKINEESIPVDEGPYHMDEVPSDVFKRYWAKRLKVTDQGIEDMAVAMQELVDRYVDVGKAKERPYRTPKGLKNNLLSIEEGEV